MPLPELQDMNPKRNPATLSAKLNKSLASYVAAASADVLASALPADAEVVYTPVNIPILINTPVALDLNHDGMADFQLSNHYLAGIAKTCTVCSFFEQASLKVTPDQTGNAAWAITSSVVSRGGAFRRKKAGDTKVDVAAPAFGGVIVAPGRKFHAGDLVMDSVEDFQTLFGFYSTKSVGPWGKGRQFTGPYLGLKFTIGGEVHFGWARINVHAEDLTITATLTGYAYETIPNRGIITGVTHGTFDQSAGMNAPPSNSPVAESASLGRLAQGATGLRAWRETRAVSENTAPVSGN